MSDKENFLKSMNEHIANGMVKVHLTFPPDSGGPAGESLWAWPLTDTTCRIANIPFFSDDVGLDDIVSVEPGEFLREFVEVIHKATVSQMVQYKLPESMGDARIATTDKQRKDLRGVYTKLRDHFRSHGIRAEGITPGAASLAIPEWMEDKDVEHAFATCPVKINPPSYIDRENAKAW